MRETRKLLAKKYIHGRGIEIGALQEPLEVPPDAKVTYVDRLPVAGLRKLYPELGDVRIVDPDIIDDGEKLSKIPDASQDFVIANHFLEHCQDPIGAIKNLYRVMKSGSILYMAVPDKRYTFDKDRPITPLSHLIRDHQEGPAWSRVSHFDEYARLVDHAGKERAEHLMKIGYSIHCHVWTKKEMLGLLRYTDKNCQLCLENVQENGIEVILILSKSRSSLYRYLQYLRFRYMVKLPF